MAGDGAATRTTSRRSKKVASKSTPSSSPPSAPHPPPPGAAPPVAPKPMASLSTAAPQAGFPFPLQPSPPSVDGLWPGSSRSIRAGHSPQGNNSPNMWRYLPPGGFVNFINQPQFPVGNLGENFHFVGVNQAFNPFSPTPQSPYSNGSPPAAAAPPPLVAERVAHIDNDEDVVVKTSRTTKKRHWTLDEEERLASAWLNTSKDPIYGNDKSRETFWGQISNLFNKNIEDHLKRDINQLKIHWVRLNKSLTEFNGYYSSVTKIEKSGYSDDMLIDEAQQMYKKKYGKIFTMEHWWKKLRKEPKWCASIAQLEKDKSKIVDIDGTDDGEEERPIGREAAKAQRKGKRKLDEVKDGISMLGDNINKIAEITQERKKDRERVTEAQLEISRNQLKAAMEQKESKLLEAYTSLLVQDTSQMTQEAKAIRDQALTSLTQKLFGKA